MKQLQIVHHPLIQESLTILRDTKTSLDSFRVHSDRVSELVLSESLKGLETKPKHIETPLTTTEGQMLSEDVVIIPVLRAGIAMLFSSMHLLPQAKVGFVGLQRDETTAVASEYYWKLPEITKETVVMITDPMLATGGSLLHLLDQVEPLSPKRISIVCVIAAPEGVKVIQEKYPDVTIFTAALDEKLNDKKYIVPGLGDYGDKYFGTK